MGTYRHTASPCPKCGKPLDASTGVGERGAPRPGDLSVCVICASVLIYTEGLGLRLATPAELDELPKDVLIKIRLAQTITKSATDAARGREYSQQVFTMAENAARWRSRNPTADAKIQFNFPQEIGFIAPISEAIRKGVITANTDGLSLIKSLWPWDQPNEPTVFMLKFALDLADKKMSPPPRQ